MDIGKKVKITTIPDPVVAPVFPAITREREPVLVPVRKK